MSEVEILFSCVRSEWKKTSILCVNEKKKIVGSVDWKGEISVFAFNHFLLHVDSIAEYISIYSVQRMNVFVGCFFFLSRRDAIIIRE